MTVELSFLGWDQTLDAAYHRATRFPRPDCQPARVARTEQGVSVLITASGVQRASLGGAVMIAAAYDPKALPAAGDWVVLRTWPDQRTTVEAVLARRGTLVATGSPVGLGRPGAVIAANLDTIAVVLPASEPDLSALPRLLARIRGAGAAAVLVLTKTDLVGVAQALPSTRAGVAEVAPELAVYPVSGRTGTGLAALARLVGPGRTLGLIGPSGGGKSTLAAALAGVTTLGTARLRRAGLHRARWGGAPGGLGAGSAALVPVPGAGAVLDTASVVSLGGCPAGPDDLAEAASDLAEAAGHAAHRRAVRRGGDRVFGAGAPGPRVGWQSESGSHRRGRGRRTSRP